jgi:ankyrin repeat protein
MRKQLFAVALSTAFALTLAVAQAAGPSLIADAAQRGDLAAVQELLRKQADVNAAQGDGMTALHWASLHGDVMAVDVLLKAKAAVEPTTRLGNYTPLHLATSRGNGAVVARLLAAGAKATAITSTGVQPIHLAAQAGDVVGVQALLAAGADVNAKDTTHERSPLIFAVSENRADVVKLLLAKGANIQHTTKVIDYVERSRADSTDRSTRDRELAAALGKTAPSGRGSFDPNDPDPQVQAAIQQQAAAGGGRGGRAGGGGPRPPSDLENIGKQGGFTALHYAVRDGDVEAAEVLMEAKADINAPSAGDKSTPLIVATVNGQYDLAVTLLERGANPNLANDDGVTPLFAAINNEWALRTWYPQPTAGSQQKASYLQLMEALLKKGADPNARTLSHIWYASYNTGRMGVDFAGATAFWRAAYALDVDAMRLLTKYGADPNLATKTFGAAKRPNDQSGLDAVPAGGPHVPAFHAASGVGYGTSRVAQQHRTVPDGWMPAAKYFLEELKVDVNVRDADGFTALHHAAARGDNEMIKYLVSKGANVMAVNRAGQTTVDMANSPEQRTQPFPETIKLLEGMGAKNNNRCQACK